jgi:hypothetical protein
MYGRTQVPAALALGAARLLPALGPRPPPAPGLGVRGPFSRLGPPGTVLGSQGIFTAVNRYAKYFFWGKDEITLSLMDQITFLV